MASAPSGPSWVICTPWPPATGSASWATGNCCGASPQGGTRPRSPPWCGGTAGKSQAEAAELLGWKVRTVSARVTQAHQELLRRLNRRGISLPAALCAAALSREAASAAVDTGPSRPNSDDMDHEPSLLGLGLFCGGFPVGLVLYAIGLRLACYLAEAPVPGFFKALGVTLLSLVLLFFVQWGVGELTGTSPLAEDATPDRAVSRLLMFPAAAITFAILYIPALGASVFQSVRIILIQLVYAGLFIVGFVLYGLSRSIFG